MASAALRVGALLVQPLLDLRSPPEREMSLTRRVCDALLHLGELQFEDLLQLLRPESFEHDYLIQAVHELGGEFALGRVQGRTRDPVVQTGVGNRGLNRKSDAALR